MLLAMGRSENRLTIAAIATFHRGTGPFFVSLWISTGTSSDAAMELPISVLGLIGSCLLGTRPVSFPHYLLEK